MQAQGGKDQYGSKNGLWSEAHSKIYQTKAHTNDARMKYPIHIKNWKKKTQHNQMKPPTRIYWQ